jgi:hypothetical protein
MVPSLVPAGQEFPVSTACRASAASCLRLSRTAVYVSAVNVMVLWPIISLTTLSGVPAGQSPRPGSPPPSHPEPRPAGRGTCSPALSLSLSRSGSAHPTPRGHLESVGRVVLEAQDAMLGRAGGEPSSGQRSIIRPRPAGGHSPVIGLGQPCLKRDSDRGNWTYHARQGRAAGPLEA